MNKDDYKEKVKKIIEEAETKGLIKTYSEFLETEEAKIYSLSEDEEKYYISKHKERLRKSKQEI